ncbi:hypothetical protein BJY59DRAFT_306828 [Rhodotorula toruloides]
MFSSAPLLARAAVRPALATVPSTPSRVLSLYTCAPLMRRPAVPSKLLLSMVGGPRGVFQTRSHTTGPASPPPPPPSSPPPPLHSSSSSRQSSGRHYSWSGIAKEAFEWLFLLWALGVWFSASLPSCQASAILC